MEQNTDSPPDAPDALTADAIAATWIVHQWAAALDVASAEEYVAALQNTVESTSLALSAWGRLLWLLLRPVGNFAVLSWPTVRRYSLAAGRIAAAQSWTAILVELALLAAIAATWRLVTFVRRREYVTRLRAAVDRRRKWFVAGVRRRSQRLAAALPHLCYAAACLLVSRLAGRLGFRPQFLALVLTFEPVLAVGYPATRTLLALGAEPPEQRVWLKYWAVWAGAQLGAGLVLAIPFAGSLLHSSMVTGLLHRWLPFLQELPFCCFLWLQLPGCRGVHSAYDALIPPLMRRTRGAAGVLPAVPPAIKGALAMVLLPVLGYERRNAIGEAMGECGVMLVGLIFILTPTPIARVGLLLLALGNPLMRTVDALDADAEAARPKPAEAGGAAGALFRHGQALVRGAGAAEADADSAAAARRTACTKQLRYWLSYTLLRGGLWAFQPLLSWVPFMVHIQLLGVLWLQLPFFRAATRVLAIVLRTLRGGGGGAAGGDEAAAAAVAAPGSGERTSRPNALYSDRLRMASRSPPESPSK